MKKNIFVILLSTLAINAFSQCPINDSTEMGPNGGNDIFYSLKDKIVSTVANNNWHMAISVMRSQFPSNPSSGVAIRINSGVLGMTVSKLPNTQSATNWRNIDTAGLYALPKSIDSDSSWYMSAFTEGYTGANPFNFIWGSYNTSSKNIDGSNVFILKNESNTIVKKVFIQQLTFDTMWHIIISNIDNSDSVNVKIRKGDYPNKMFAYYDVVANKVLDREPALNTWDLLWTKYNTFAVSSMGSGVIPVVGVLRNPNITVERNEGKKCDQVWLLNKTSVVNPKISLIGSNWKKHIGGGVYEITDTFVYFINTNATTYKMTFKGYVGGAKTISLFNVYESTLSLKENEISSINIYPNPANGIVTIKSEFPINKIQVLDMMGKIIYNGSSNSFDVSEFAAGVYVINIQTENQTLQTKLIKE